MEENNEKITKEKLEEEIAALKTRIKNTEYDLAHMFKGNSLLEQKLEISKKTLEEKARLLNELSKDENKEEELKNFEDEVAEKADTSISEEQEEVIDKIIEEEIGK